MGKNSKSWARVNKKWKKNLVLNQRFKERFKDLFDIGLSNYIILIEQNLDSTSYGPSKLQLLRVCEKKSINTTEKLILIEFGVKELTLNTTANSEKPPCVQYNSDQIMTWWFSQNWKILILIYEHRLHRCFKGVNASNWFYVFWQAIP